MDSIGVVGETVGRGREGGRGGDVGVDGKGLEGGKGKSTASVLKAYSCIAFFVAIRRKRVGLSIFFPFPTCGFT